MEKRLIKIATELNVGTSTIVEHLARKGFLIEDKPTAKVTDEMYDVLIKDKDFQDSIAVKEKADQLIIGARPGIKKEPTPVTPVFKKEPVSITSIFKKEPPVEKAPPVVEKEEPVVVVETPEPEPAVEKIKLHPLKILGKIDLDPRPARKEEPPVVVETPKEEPVTPVVVKEPEPPVVVIEKIVETPVVQTPVETPVQIPVQAPTPPPVEVKKVEEPVAEIAKEEVVSDKEEPGVEQSDFHRAETPQLKGLKILGKIDTDKFKKPKKKKKEKEREKPKAASGGPAGEKKAAAPEGAGNTPSTTQGGLSAEDKKRKRKRKKVATSSGGEVKKGPADQKKPATTQSPAGTQNRTGTSTGGGNRRNPDEVKEISQKEIDDKIKATMARLTGAGKNKRQKMRRDKRESFRERKEAAELEKQGGKLQVTEFISVTELASLLDVPVSQVITTCMNLGVIVSINQRLDAEIIELVSEEFGYETEFISAEDQTQRDEEDAPDDPADLHPRAPIVAVMGHVDHGKTSLLDYIRNTNVAGGEAGGITQHIGAYEVVKEGKKITFLDTPGHEAFTAMRARGAKVTDVAVVIIAADDNIMPQTKEAISHAQAASVPIVFAINKIDKAGADPTRIKNELAGMNFLVEEWGGKYQSQDISAKAGTNVDLLLEKILLEAEILDLKANSNRKAVGTVIEASLDKGRGYVTKMLVQTGTLNVGDAIVAGEHSGKVKAMFNERGKRLQSAGPSSPVLVLGLGGAPQAGEKFKVMESESEARQIAGKRAQISREQANRASKRISLDEIGRRLALGTFKELNLIVKGDVDGSVEALSDALLKLSIEKVQVNVIHKAVGQIIESDVLLASASDAIIIGFQVRPSLSARKLAEREGVQIKMYSIIYEAIGEIRAAIEGMLEPTKEEHIVGQVEVREVYKISKVGTVAGCYVQEGKITRQTHIRVIRDGIVVFPTREGAHGKVSSLKRFKEDQKEVKAGLECGITIDNFNDIKEGDIIESYEINEVKQKLDN